MKISKVFLKPQQIAALAITALNQEEKAELRALLAAGNVEENKPVGYSYCDAEDGLSASVFLSTNREGGGAFRTKNGDICLNIKTFSAQKKGDHKASEAQPEVPAQAHPEDMGADIPF